MNSHLRLHEDAHRAFDIRSGTGALLWRYVYAPEVPANEAPRPYAHPVCSRAGEVLTNFRPNDHPWHHALSLTLTRVDDTNFWGGPSYAAADGYRWRDDHGRQVHLEWKSREPARLVETLVWLDRHGRVLLNEERTLVTELQDDGWRLRWTSELTNASGRALRLGNYHSDGGLAGSHYTGLQFRGARDLLDEHGDATIGITADGGLSGEAAVHGAMAHAMEWSCQHDTSLRRTRIRFENVPVPIPWFVRRKHPFAVFAFQRDEPQTLGAGAQLRLEHVLTFLDA